MSKNLQSKAASICNRLFSRYWIKWVHLDVLHIFFIKTPLMILLLMHDYGYIFSTLPSGWKKRPCKEPRHNNFKYGRHWACCHRLKKNLDWKTATFKAVFASHWKFDKKCHVFNMIKRILFYFLKHTFI